MVDENELRELARKWQKTAMEQVPDGYASRGLHSKYLKLDNYASGLDDCAIELLELLDSRSPTLRAAVQSEQNLAVPDDIEVRVQLRNLLGYLEIDLENRELDEKDAWEETYQVVNDWLNTPNSNRSAGG